MQAIDKLQGVIQHYIWGGNQFLPELLGFASEPEKTYAEYWLGAHPAGLATINAGTTPESISQWLQQNHQPHLPYLFKVLDVHQMLSIQVHPTKQQAADGFAQENANGIPLDAKHRNYKDSNHKPELMLALSPFWLLHGLRNTPDIVTELSAKPCLAPLLECLRNSGLESAFAMSLDSSNATVNNMQEALKQQLLNSDVEFEKHHIDFWAHRWLSQHPNTTTGILTLYFMNLVQLEPGQAIYQPPGLLHAYLEGKNVELMANSDNVLRAGLTPKHIDVNELLKICALQATDVNNYIIAPIIQTIETDASTSETTYPTPFPEFELSKIETSKQFAWHSMNTEIIFCWQGSTKISNGVTSIELAAGEAAIIAASENITANAESAQSSLLFRVKS